MMTTEERTIITKMAEYVVRNGSEFEDLVMKQKSKDQRFSFLQPDHPYHSFYMSKRREFDPDDSLTKAADAASLASLDDENYKTQSNSSGRGIHKKRERSSKFLIMFNL